MTLLPPPSPDVEDFTSAIDPEIIALIERLGYDTDGIIVTDDAYIVEDHIKIPKDILEEIKNQPSTRALTTDGGFHSSRNGGTLLGPNIEPTGVLYTGKDYSWSYRATAGSWLPDYDFFYESALGVMQNSSVITQITSSQDYLELDYSFSEPGEYTVKGNNVWIGHIKVGGGLLWDVETRFIENYQSITYSVIDRESLLSISGPAMLSVNSQAAYSVQSPLPEGVTFNNWTISPSGATISSPNSLNTTISSFPMAATYTLSANFTLPDNVPYSVTKSVYVGHIPSISADRYVVWPGETLTCTVTNPIEGARYDWELDGMSNWAWDMGPSLLINHHYLNDPEATIRCRVKFEGVQSGWSAPLTVYVSDIIYRAPARQEDEEEEKGTEIPAELQE